MNELIFYEDIEVGYELVSPGRTLTEADIVNFAGLSGDFNSVHTDAEFAKKTPFGQRIAHGLLGLSMASGLIMRSPGISLHQGIAFLGMTWDFRQPVFIGDTVHVVQTVSSKRPTKRPGLGIVIYDSKIFNQHGTVCQEGNLKMLYMMRNVVTPAAE